MWFEQDGSLHVWRAMYVTTQWIEKPGRCLGVYWSHDPAAASPYDYSDEPDTVLLKMRPRIAPEHVWWDAILDLHPRGEAEVRLESGTPLTLDAAWIDGEVGMIAHLTGAFRA